MNNSGQAVQKLMFYYDISLNDILIIHDDIDLSLGEIKLQKDRSSAGHRGIQSIIDQLNSKNFWRLRIGVAKKEKEKTGDAAKFVLNKFSLFERKKLKKIIKQAIDEIKNQFL
jgi:PTH1 family peptidyl-tRNA hydrolase